MSKPEDSLFGAINPLDLAAATKRPAPPSFLEHRASPEQDAEVDDLLGLNEQDAPARDPLFEGYDDLEF
jgi:hypothetical protein